MRPFISLSLDSFLKDFMSFWCFVFFRCLIYKVRTRSLFVPDGDLLYHFVTSLSSPFLNLFSGLSRPSSRPFGPASRPLSSELCYLTTLSRSCQVLFSLPIKLFYQFFLGSCLAAERSVNIPNTAAIVNTFFDFFCLFSSGPLCHNISCPQQHQTTIPSLLAGAPWSALPIPSTRPAVRPGAAPASPR